MCETHSKGDEGTQKATKALKRRRRHSKGDEGTQKATKALKRRRGRHSKGDEEGILESGNYP